MSESDAAVSGLGPEHCRAICDEIGEQLRYSLAPTTSGLPLRIAELLASLAEQDHDAPSIVPSRVQTSDGIEDTKAGKAWANQHARWAAQMPRDVGDLWAFVVELGHLPRPASAFPPRES
jgi:hypothetical protein